MHSKPHFTQTTAIALVILLGVAAFAFACHLTTHSAMRVGDAPPSLAESLFGDARIALADSLYEHADTYFHRGVPHLKKRAFTQDLFQRLRAHVSPREHIHLSGPVNIREFMPWLDLATRLNPHDPEPALVAAFWMEHEAQRPDLALKILNHAQQRISYAYRIQLEKGRLFIHRGDIAEARRALDAAVAFWTVVAEHGKSPDRHDKATILRYRALLREYQGDTAGAIKDLRELQNLAPAHKRFQDRLNALQAGRSPTPSARKLLDRLLRTETHARQRCKHEEDHAEHHHHHEG